MTHKRKIIFGPVVSRRLGISLGVDLLPSKICTLNCVYCEVGRTTTLTLERQEFYPLEDVLAELDAVLGLNPKLDVVTFAGSGEPMLYSRFGEIIRYLKKYYPQYKTCLLTNGTLFYDPEVRAQAMEVDIVVPSVDAATEYAFRKINRNLPQNTLPQIFEGLEIFSREYRGDLQLEVFIVPGINDCDEEIYPIVEVAKRLNPSAVQLNSLDRPGTEKWTETATPSSLAYIASCFAPLRVDIVSKFKGKMTPYQLAELPELIVQTVERRPCTLQDFVDITGNSSEDVQAVITNLEQQGRLLSKMEKRGRFYFLNRPR